MSATEAVKRTSAGITFRVDDVERAAEALPECRAHEAVRALLGGAVESCSDYHGTVVKGLDYHGLLAAVHTAFSQHRPLVLTPDAVWITVAQGVAQHMAIHGESLRDRFVAHDGRLELAVDVTGFVKGSPENLWADAFAGWSERIRAHVGAAVHNALRCDFSTSGPHERAAGDIVVMDVFERYFHYRAYCICGIPEVTLEGATADWESIRVRIEVLERFDMGWWAEHLRPICDQFVRASRGDVDVEHWRAICKLRDEYGGAIINGWVAKLFPYLREFIGGPVRRRNPVFETGEGFQTLDAPSGLSRVPFVWNAARADGAAAAYDMEAVGGLLGVTQDPGTMALRPKVGWAVREVTSLDALLNRVEREHGVRLGTGVVSKTEHRKHDGKSFTVHRELDIPEDLAAFYFRTDGAELFGRGEAARFRIVRMAGLRPHAGPPDAESVSKDRPRMVMSGPAFVRFCELGRGGYVVIERQDYQGSAVFAYTPGLVWGGWWTRVAESFAEFLGRAIASGGAYWWEAGDAD